jgi:cob(I)alamin adenosyltransferase
MDKGLVLINTGPGQGKTTAALGTLVRALGQGLTAAFLQFIKSQETGESRFLKEYALAHPGRLYYNRFGLGFIKEAPTAEDRARAAEAMTEAERLTALEYDLVVLDEICVAANRGLIAVPDVVRLIEKRRPAQHLILTGRGCPEELMALAHTVTEMNLVKHAFEQGIPAKRGLEF